MCKGGVNITQFNNIRNMGDFTTQICIPFRDNRTKAALLVKLFWLRDCVQSQKIFYDMMRTSMSLELRDIFEPEEWERSLRVLDKKYEITQDMYCLLSDTTNKLIKELKSEEGSDELLKFLDTNVVEKTPRYKVVNYKGNKIPILSCLVDEHDGEVVGDFETIQEVIEQTFEMCY